MEQYDKNIFAKNLSAALTRRGINQREFADMIGVSKGAVSTWCRAIKTPRMDKIEHMANILGLKKSDLIEERFPAGAVPLTESYFAPVLGRVPAGYPVYALEDELGRSPVDPDVSRPEECYWLVVQGDSMVGAGINPGDRVLVRHQDCAENGQIVVCRLNGDEATLKRFHRQGDQVLLQPENAVYAPIIVPAAQFASGEASILGVVIRAVRNFA